MQVVGKSGSKKSLILLVLCSLLFVLCVQALLSLLIMMMMAAYVPVFMSIQTLDQSLTFSV